MIWTKSITRYLNRNIIYFNCNLNRTSSSFNLKSNKKSHSNPEYLAKSNQLPFDLSKNLSGKNFETDLSLRRNQASNSILFKIENESDLLSLVEDLEKIGSKVSTILVLDELSNLNSRTVLVEFLSRKSIDLILNNNGIHFSNSDHLPCKTRLFVYRNQIKKNNLKILNKNVPIKKYTYRKQDQINNQNIKLNDKFSFINPSQSLDKQITMIYDRFKLDEIGIKIRFFIASIIEESFCGLFLNCICLPFGSSAVNIGHQTSDLDLLFSIENTFLNNQIYEKNQYRLNGKMMFYSKYKKNEKERAIFFLELFKLILSDIIPKFNVKQLIKSARVPILEFDFELPSGQKLSCDLSMSNLQISYQMTKLFWTYTQIDNRIAPLIFFLKFWAKITGVTNTFRPSPNITNFQLTVLILNFLLRLDKPLIVPLENITKSFKGNDFEPGLKYIINENLNLSDINDLIKEKNKTTLNELLMGFFNYYSNFDFDSNVISLSRQMNIKTDKFKHEALIILNPFMPEMNASKNVNRKLLKKFVFFCNQSYEFLQANDSVDLVQFFEFLKTKSTMLDDKINQISNIADEMNT